MLKRQKKKKGPVIKLQLKRKGRQGPCRQMQNRRGHRDQIRTWHVWLGGALRDRVGRDMRVSGNLGCADALHALLRQLNCMDTN